MLAAMAPSTRKLDPEDAKRNVHRGHLILRVAGSDRTSPDATFESLLTEEVDGEVFRANVLREKEQCIQVYCDIPRKVDPNYPSLDRIPFSWEVKRIGVQVSVQVCLHDQCSSRMPGKTGTCGY